jgi:hypothetical protein
MSDGDAEKLIGKRFSRAPAICALKHRYAAVHKNQWPRDKSLGIIFRRYEPDCDYLKANISVLRCDKDLH